MRIVGLDVSRSVAEIAYLEDGVLHAGGRAGLRRDELERFAASLRSTDHVVLEATGNTAAIVNVLRPRVARVAIANPLLVRLIAEARVKTDRIDAAVLAQLYASHFLPEVWMPDESTLALRRQVSRRSQLVRQRTRLKNEVHAVLAAHLIERCPATDLFGRKGRVWLTVPIPRKSNSRSAAKRASIPGETEHAFHSKASAADMATRGELFYSFSPSVVKPFRRFRIDSPESVKRCAL
ncbi:protein of unknown function (plasmid) [Paraburkholderia dioscoreae]|uniref:Transposase IS110-like N-terminal domain-containing protein n=1 Tax=Paraburkholderia dioscoreae TaxID=2604047 RepID=A0A5Q4ZIE8_9BURK|nr:protein of unknown function [Paraburkholderia dioscoreae]